MITFKVSISTDLAFPLNNLGSLHDYLGPVPPSPLTYVPVGAALDFPAPMFWPPGMAMGMNQLSTKTLHRGLPICLAGHDIGVLIPHVQVAPSPSNSMTPLHLMFSSRKSTFPAAQVVIEGKPVTACTLTSLPPAPMLVCADPVTLPTGGAPTSHLNTLQFGMTLAAYLSGVLAAAATVAVEAVLAGIKIKKGDMVVERIVSRQAFDEAAEKFGREATQEALQTITRRKVMDSLQEKLMPWNRDALIKQGVGAATGAVRAYATDGPAAVKAGVGSPYLKMEAGVSRDAGGDWTAGGGGQMGSPAGTLQEKATFGDEEKGTTVELGGGHGLGGSKATASSGAGDTPSETGGGSTYHSPNPANWGAPL